MRTSSLVTNAPIFPRLAEQTLREIEPFLCFCQLLLDVLDTMFECFEPLSDLGRYGSREIGTQASYLDCRERNNRRDGYEWAKKTRVHVAFRVQGGYCS